MFYQQETIAIIIDGPNTHSAAVNLGLSIDWKALNTEFMNRGRLLRSYYFTANFSDEETHSAMRPLIDWLSYNGFETVISDIKHDTPESMAKGRRESTVELTVTAMNVARKVDHVILFTGDGMFVPLVDAMKQIGTKVTVISTISSGTKSCSDILRRQADHFIDLEVLRDKISKLS